MKYIIKPNQTMATGYCYCSECNYTKGCGKVCDRYMPNCRTFPYNPY
ncbi:MAG: DUF4778 domain-containing protein [Clostridia bacterium]|nr:DUF4778 domain-containing protein [Clostridia bacterium]